MPSPHALGALALTVVVFFLFAQGRLRNEVICLVLIGVLALWLYFFPIPDPEAMPGLVIAFGGFGHEALVAICCLMIMAKGLTSTGALRPVTNFMSLVWTRNRSLGLLISLLICGGISMFVNDTPVLVLVLPILLKIAEQTGNPASYSLMPVNCAILIGGMITTIGTSTNVLIVSLSRDHGVPALGVFDYFDIGIIAALVGIAYLWLIMPRILPAHHTISPESPRRYFASLFLDEQSPSLGASVAEARTRLGDRIDILGVTRRGVEVKQFDLSGLRFEPGDVMHIEGALSDLRDSSDRMRASLVPPGVARLLYDDPTDGQIIAEVVVGADSTLVNESIRSAGMAERYGAAVIGLFRPTRAFYREKLDTTDERLEVGDVLLIQGSPNRLNKLQVDQGAMMLEGAAEIPRTALGSAALLIVGSVVTLMALKIVPVAIAALGGVIAMIVTRVIPFERLGRALNAEVIVLVAASIALGRSLTETGAADWLGGVLSQALGPLPPAFAVAGVMTFCALITNFSSNAAAASVTTPIAVSIAEQLGINPLAMVVAVIFGCNFSFATPVAYQTNILIMAAAGYRFGDFVRAGGPLVVLMIIVCSFLLAWKYNL